MDFEVCVWSDDEGTCVEARVPCKGFWERARNFFFPYVCVAKVTIYGKEISEWCRPGWEHALSACREEFQ